METRFYGRSHVGRRRKVNEDSFLYSREAQFMVLADGMGGHQSGEVASRMAVDGLKSLIDACRPTQVSVEHPVERERYRGMITCLFNEWIQRTNTSIYVEGTRRGDARRMGTTLTCFYAYRNLGVFAHVGDSRIYRLRREVLEQVTTDHSVANERLRAQEVTRAEARRIGLTHVITRALGTHPVVRPEIEVQEIFPGEVYLTCSDGLHDLVQDYEIREVLLAFRERLDRAADVLIELANRRGGHDNITVVIAELGTPGAFLADLDGDTEQIDAEEATELMEDVA